MSSVQIEKIVRTYKFLSKIPACLSGHINKSGTIKTVWSHRNIEKGKSTKFTRIIFTSENYTKIDDSFPVDVSNELINRSSPSEKYQAILREADTNQFLEIWQNQNMIRCVDLKALDVHGSIYSDGEFASFEWSPDEKKLLYVAEKKIPKSDPFYKRVSNDDSNKSGDAVKPKVGEEYLFEQDWGEQLVGKKKSVLVQYDIENDNVEILQGIPENLFVAQPSYTTDGSLIVGIAYETEPRKLGLIFCNNRRSTIFQLDLKGNYSQIPLTDQAVKRPRLSPDGKWVFWLQRKSGGPHAACLALMKTALPITNNVMKSFIEESTSEVLINIVKTEQKIVGNKTFYGIYEPTITRRCWGSNNRLLFTTCQENIVNSYVLNIDSGEITELEAGGDSLIVLDVYNDYVLAVRRDFLIPDRLVIGLLPSVGSESSVKWVNLIENENVSGLEDKIYKYLNLSQGNDSFKRFTAIYLGPKEAKDKEIPLIVWPHGGPHSSFRNCFILEVAMFLSLNYGILLINYRGSIGAGQDSVDFLLGKVGESDVSDCILATDTVLQSFSCLNPNIVFLVGGSHGGFLVTHLSGQYPDRFKAVVARNPVIDIASMSILSDIPDWCYVEAGSEYTQKGSPSDEILLKMRNASPIMHAHKVKAPTLLQIGSKDLRVPSHQALEHYTRLKANGTTVRMNLYDDNHPLASVPNEMDNVINTIVWLEQHK